jgi:hypothetical protein
MARGMLQKNEGLYVYTVCVHAVDDDDDDKNNNWVEI